MNQIKNFTVNTAYKLTDMVNCVYKVLVTMLRETDPLMNCHRLTCEVKEVKITHCSTTQ